MTLHFPSWNALILALTRDLLPAEVVREGGEVAFNDKNEIWFTPAHLDSNGLPRELPQFGISINGTMPGQKHRVDHLWQAISLQRIPTPQQLSPNLPVLFVVNDAQRLTRFVNELLRLGNDRIGIRHFAGRYLVIVQGPPYYALLPSLDRSDEQAPLAFIEQTTGFWVAIGWMYPLAEHIVVPDDQLIIVSPYREWTVIPASPFRDVADCLQIQPPNVQDLDVQKASVPWPIPIQLTKASTSEQPTLWILRGEAIEQLDALAQSIDNSIMDRFAFALCESVGFIRLRPNRLERPNVEIPGVSYRGYMRLPNLFVPITDRLSPPLHRETLRKTLAADPNLLHIVSSNQQVETIAESAFRPLSSYINDVLQRDREALHDWAMSTQFAFAELTQEESLSEPTSSSNKPVAASTPKSVEEVRAKNTAPLIRQRQRALFTPPLAAAPIPKTDADRRTQLANVEHQFVELGGALNSPERRGLWPQLARLNAELRQPAEAALAWTQALWDSDTFADEQLWGWVWTEQALPHPDLKADALAGMMLRSTPTPGEMRTFASVLTWAGQSTPIPTALRQVLPQVQSYLQTHEHLLPIRAVWLAWLSWSRAAGGDALTLARARDRLLTRLLDRGLNPEVDLPSFLRFAGREDGEQLRAVRGWIEEIRQIVRKWYFHQTKAVKSHDPTGAYIDLLFAIGFARLGEASSSRALVKDAEAILTRISGDTADAHDFLLQAFSWRVEEVLSGRFNNPWSPELLDYLKQLRKEREPSPNNFQNDTYRTVTYAIERLREQLRLLEPQENFDPYRSQNRRHLNELVQAATQLADEHSVQLLLVKINELIRKASVKPDVLVNVLSGIMPLAGRLGADQAGKLLDRVIPAFDSAGKPPDVYSLESRFHLLERSLYYAGHYDRAELIPGFIERIVGILEKEDVQFVLEKISRALGETLRNLRKFGLRDQTLVLLDRIHKAILKNRTFELLVAGPISSWAKSMLPLLNVAAGWIYLDQSSRAEPILAAAVRLLDSTGRSDSETIHPNTYVAALYNTIVAYGYLPTHIARERIIELFERIRLQRLPNNFTIQSFYSWFHLNVAEAVVLALASHEFALGSAARHWLDEDEYLIRQRVHRDVRSVVGRS